MLGISLFRLSACFRLEYIDELTRGFLFEFLLTLLEGNTCHNSLRYFIDLRLEGVFLERGFTRMLFRFLLNERVHVELLVSVEYASFHLVVDFFTYKIDFRFEGAFDDLFNVVLLANLRHLLFLFLLVVLDRRDKALFI